MSINKKISEEYLAKHAKALRIAEQKKNELYTKLPEIEQCEKEMVTTAIAISKKMITMTPLEKNKEKKILEKKLKEIKQRMNNILYENGYSKNYFEPQYECKLCNDTGLIEKDGVNIMCKCYKQKLIDSLYDASNLKKIDQENFKTFDLGYYSNVANQEKFGSELSPRENIQRIKEKAIKFIENFEDENEKSIFFTGKTGLGKTFLSNCIAKEILDKGYNVMYQTSTFLIGKLIDIRFKNDTSEEAIKFSEEIYNADLLIIDDLGTETVTSHKYEELFNLINTRLNNKKKTIISSNLDLEGLMKRYDERIFSRIVGEFNLYRFFGDDIRILRKRLEK